jgi:hypothetical protein
MSESILFRIPAQPAVYRHVTLSEAIDHLLNDAGQSGWAINVSDVSAEHLSWRMHWHPVHNSVGEALVKLADMYLASAHFNDELKTIRFVSNPALLSQIPNDAYPLPPYQSD